MFVVNKVTFEYNDEYSRPDESRSGIPIKIFNSYNDAQDFLWAETLKLVKDSNPYSYFGIKFYNSYFEDWAKENNIDYIKPLKYYDQIRLPANLTMEQCQSFCREFRLELFTIYEVTDNFYIKKL